MKLSTRRVVLFELVLPIVLLGVCSACAVSTAAQLKPAKVRLIAPDFARANQKGATLNLSDYKGHVVLLDFWATWCHGCKTEIPWYMEFEGKYKEQGLIVIGVSMDADGWKSVKPFMAEKKMNDNVVIGDDDLAKRFDLANMPLTLLIDRNGRIADSHAGVVDKTAWEHEIQDLLKENGKGHRPQTGEQLAF